MACCCCAAHSAEQLSAAEWAAQQQQAIYEADYCHLFRSGSYGPARGEQLARLPERHPLRQAHDAGRTLRAWAAQPAAPFASNHEAAQVSNPQLGFEFPQAA